MCIRDRYQEAISQLRSALGNYVANRVAPTKEQREKFRYPKITLTYDPDGPAPVSSRAYAKFNAPGTYTTTITPVSYTHLDVYKRQP